MGLLDDAIREHLELKRRHGADPTEVARQEQEALGPVRAAAPQAAEAPAEAAPEAPAASEDESRADSLATDASPEHDGAVAPERFAPEPDLDWTDPALPDPAGPVAPEADPEDVLEETPEFLEETPEHDRLWFEQRPPKDFDF